MRPRPLPVGSGPAALAVTGALLDAVHGGGPVAPVPPGGQWSGPDDDRLDASIALVVGTSGSTGAAKSVLLPGSALLASVAATQDRLGGPGGWLLCLPPWHIAGLQVLLRAAVAGTPIAAMDESSFTAAGFTAAAAGLDAPRRYVSVVPTQLHRILEDATATRALAGFDAVLVGGAATGADLLARALDAGISAVTTYGMTETCGGCVYDGVPLTGVQVSIEHDVVALSGPMVARGYLGLPEDPAFPTPGTFVTNDLGAMLDGRLVIHGRADDVIVTGGLKVPAGQVESALSSIPGAGEVLVVGVPDPEWGAVVTVLHTGLLHDDTVERALAGMPRHYRPRRLLAVPELPLLPSGKPDRAAAAIVAAPSVAAGSD